MQLVIDTMTREQIGALAALEALVFSTPWSAAAFEEELYNPQALFLVAEDAEKQRVAGYVGLHIVCGEGSVLNLAVHPDYRRQKVATALLDTALRFARAHQLTRLMLEVRASNEGAIALYEGIGFRLDGRRPRFYTAPVEDALLYSLFLKNDFSSGENCDIIPS